MALDVYPTVGLVEALERLEEARKLLASGIDPGQQRRAEKIALVVNPDETFGAVAREWFGVFSVKWVATHSSKVLLRLENDLIPWLGARAVRFITAPEVLVALKRIAARGAHETSRRAL